MFFLFSDLSISKKHYDNYSLCVFPLYRCALISGKYFPIKPSEIHGLFDLKPFNCRSCFTFHSLWMLTGIYAFLTKSLECGASRNLSLYCIFLSQTY